jgi:hypothetical protein
MSDENGGSTSAENLITLGALLVLASWILFEVIARDYFVTTVAVVLAGAIVALPRFDVEAIKAVAPVSAFLTAGAYALALTGVVELVDDIRYESFDGASATIGALVAYAGYVMAFVGARSTES